MSKAVKAYFVSDIHLGSVDEPNYKLFLNWLNQLNNEKPTHLFLVGDIFDLWIENHQYFKKKYQKLIEAITLLKNSGVEIHYFEGNHDLYLKEFWQKEIGITVHEEFACFQIGPWKIRAEHGDQVDPEDRGYLFLRWFLRTALMKWVAKHLPQSFLVKIGESASEKSRHYTSKVKTISKSESIQKLQDYAQRVYHEENFDWLITGHIHEWDDFTFTKAGKNIRSINLGTWLKKPCAYLIDETQGCKIEIK